MAASVKISQNVDILARVYLVHLKVKHCSNLTCSKYIYRSKLVNRFWLVKALSCVVDGGQKIFSKPVKNARVGSWLILTTIATCTCHWGLKPSIWPIIINFLHVLIATVLHAKHRWSSPRRWRRRIWWKHVMWALFTRLRPRICRR